MDKSVKQTAYISQRNVLIYLNPSKTVFSSSAVPGVCEAPIVTNVLKDRMTVSWKEPSDDGKSPILGYMLEKKEPKQINWTKMNRKPMMERSLEVTGLTEGVEYEFRVTAVNIAGAGKPSEASAAATAMNPISE